MKENVQLYSLLRSGAAIHLAQIERIEVSIDPPGQQRTSLRLLIEETLWGHTGESFRQYEFSEPQSEVARLKYPHPIWRHVSIHVGARVFLATRDSSQDPNDPFYVEDLADLGDAVIQAIRSVLDQERLEPDPKQRFIRYLHYLTEGPTVQKLFGAEALARDTDLPEVDGEGQVASAMAEVFASYHDVLVRLSIGGWMWEKIYPRTNSAGRLTVLNATIKGVEDPSEDIRRFSLDQLMTHPINLPEVGVRKSPEAARLIEEQLQSESSPEIVSSLQELVKVLRSEDRKP